MTVQRLLPRLWPALLAMLLIAATPVTAWFDSETAWLAHDTAGETLGTVPQGTGQTPPVVDHSSRKKPRFSASLEEFFEIDDDAEQYFKPPPAIARYGVGVAIADPSSSFVSYRSAPRTHRVCAAYPTGPPHA
jgi:hypothetical protein